LEGASDETKALIDALFEVIAREGSDPLIVYIRDVENWILNNFEAYTSFKERIERVKGRVLVMTSYISKVGDVKFQSPCSLEEAIPVEEEPTIVEEEPTIVEEESPLVDGQRALVSELWSPSCMEGVFAVRGECADHLSVDGLCFPPGMSNLAGYGYRLLLSPLKDPAAACRSFAVAVFVVSQLSSLPNLWISRSRPVQKLEACSNCSPRLPFKAADSSCGDPMV
jgi:hypothetical protein